MGQIYHIGTECFIDLALVKPFTILYTTVIGIL